MSYEAGSQEEQDIIAFQENSIYSVMHLLTTGILYRTSIEGLRSIQKSSIIIPNTGQFSCIYPQTKHYYRYSKGYVCLFDFESSKEEDYRINLDTWQGSFFDCEPVTIVLKLNREKLGDKLIRNSAAPNDSSKPDYKGFIPFVECWYPEPIPISALDNYITILYRGLDEKPIVSEYDVNKLDVFEQVLSIY